MIIRNIPLRHELKYFITPAELTVLRHSLTPLMKLDQGHEYYIRSLYFDTINDDALDEKIAGVGNRKKYRIRIYDFSDKIIKLECKSKYGDLISKQSVSIPRDLADQLIAGDPEGLQRMRHPLLHDVYREMKTRLLRPWSSSITSAKPTSIPLRKYASRLTSRFAPDFIRQTCSTRTSRPIRFLMTPSKFWKSNTTNFCRPTYKPFSAA